MYKFFVQLIINKLKLTTYSGTIITQQLFVTSKNSSDESLDDKARRVDDAGELMRIMLDEVGGGTF